MDKIKVFCDYSRACSTNDLFDSWTDEAYYPVAIASLSRSLYELSEITEEELDEEIQLIIFWALYGYGKYTFRVEEPILDVEEKDLPINMDKEEFEKFTEAIKIVTDHYNSVSYGVGKPSLIRIEHFEPFFKRTEKFTMDIPQFWLNT
jgi:hypothetical protein